MTKKERGRKKSLYGGGGKGIGGNGEEMPLLLKGRQPERPLHISEASTSENKNIAARRAVEEGSEEKENRESALTRRWDRHAGQAV